VVFRIVFALISSAFELNEGTNSRICVCFSEEARVLFTTRTVQTFIFLFVDKIHEPKSWIWLKVE